MPLKLAVSKQCTMNLEKEEKEKKKKEMKLKTGPKIIILLERTNIESLISIKAKVTACVEDYRSAENSDIAKL